MGGLKEVGGGSGQIIVFVSLTLPAMGGLKASPPSRSLYAGGQVSLTLPAMGGLKDSEGIAVEQAVDVSLTLPAMGGLKVKQI